MAVAYDFFYTAGYPTVPGGPSKSLREGERQRWDKNPPLVADAVLGSCTFHRPINDGGGVHYHRDFFCTGTTVSVVLRCKVGLPGWSPELPGVVPFEWEGGRKISTVGWSHRSKFKERRGAPPGTPAANCRTEPPMR